MTESQVFAALGPPAEKETAPAGMVWYYQECPQHEGQKVVYRPEYGIIKFRCIKLRNRLSYQVMNWKEPDWDSVLLPESAIRNTIPAKPVATQKAIQTTPTNTIIQQRQLISPPRPRPQSYEQVKTNRLVKDIKKSMDVVYFLVAGGVFLGMAIVVVLFKIS